MAMCFSSVSAGLSGTATLGWSPSQLTVTSTSRGYRVWTAQVWKSWCRGHLSREFPVIRGVRGQLLEKMASAASLTRNATYYEANNKSQFLLL